MHLPPSLRDRLSCCGASAAFGVGWDIFQWLEKSRGFCFGVCPVFRALHYTHCFCEPRQGVQHPPLIDAQGKAKQADDVARTESSLLQNHIISWGFLLPFLLLSLLNPAFSGIYLCLFPVYAFFPALIPFLRKNMYSFQSELLLEGPKSGFLLMTGKHRPQPQGAAEFSMCNLPCAVVEVLQLLA